ncbi:cation:proton antiporter [uncultured Clostridium sp.]|jgi:Kef-type K+ transport system membrane component KefB|uniref:cation:proton antiporter n=1 Tax=uncultured Clostridium sp. TaxID=59620 RepID=UPI00262FEEE1|nr:cation:proton antiporter [uncultured Clostridium sp.]
MSHKFLLDIAIILLSTKLLGLITKKLHMPQVVGALIAGLVLGPAALDILHETDFIQQIASLGVIVLMFTAGLETDIKELKKTGKVSFCVAIMGVLLPLIGGFIVSHFFNDGVGGKAMLENIFIGIILTATSVSITVETLKELGKLNTRAGNTILGAALIDDILGIIGLTLITSMADSSVNVGIVLLKIILFFVFAAIMGVVFHFVFMKWVANYKADLRRFVIVAFALCLLLSFVAEEFFGVADITGAFIAGLIISNTAKTHYINARFETLSYMILSPIFFASIGIKVELTEMNGTIVLFTLLLLIIAVTTKVFGCALGAKLCKYNNKEAFQIGTGMVSRGEVALIVASKGIAVGLMNPKFLAPVVIVVVVTTIVTPVMLKFIFRNDDKGNGEDDTSLVDKYETVTREKVY